MSAELEVVQPREAVYLSTETRGLQVAVVVSLLVIALAAFVLGAAALVEIAAVWAGLPLPVALLLPVVLDAGAVAAALASLVRRGRGQRATLEAAVLFLTAGISTAAQVVHAYSLSEGAWTAQAITVAVALGCAPLLTLGASHIAMRALVQDPRRKTPARRPAARAVKPQPAKVAAAELPQVKPAKPVAPPVSPASPGVPFDRLPDESEVDYAARLVLSGEFSQRKAAEVAGVTRSRVETALKRLESQSASV